MQSDLQKQALDYMATAQSLIDELTAGRSAYQTKAAEVGTAFVDSGLIAAENVGRFTEKLASDPQIALQYLTKLAGMLKDDNSLGNPVETKASADMTDPFVRWVTYGDPNANPGRSMSVE